MPPHTCRQRATAAAALLTLAVPFAGAQTVDQSADEASGPSTPIASAVAADHPAARRIDLQLYVENDNSVFRFWGDTDRHYTGGHGLSATFQLDPAGDNGRALGLLIAQQIYTPEDRTSGIFDPEDQFFAGYLYGGVYFQRQDGDVFDHVQLDLGVVGPSSLAEQAQETTHDITGSDDPFWVNQLRDEFTYQLTLRRKWRIDLGDMHVRDTPLAFQLIPRAELHVGNVRRALAAGADLRVGHNLPDDFGAGRLTDPRAATGQRTRGFSAYAFARAVGRFVEWDTFVQGSNRRNPSPSLDLEPLQGELGGGLAIAWQTDTLNLAVEYTQLVLSDRFEQQTSTDGLGTWSFRLVWTY